MDSQDKKSVPKFSSFKAPPTSSSRVDREQSRQSGDHKPPHATRRRANERSRSPRRSDRRDRRRSPGRRRRSRSPRHTASRDRRTSRQHIESSTPFSSDLREHENKVAGERSATDRLASRDDSGNDLYIVDEKGDRHNLTYGTTHRYAVPKYRRIGRGQVLGADERYRIDRDHLDSDSLVLRIKDSLSSTAARPLSKRVPQPTHIFRIKPENVSSCDSEMMQDFIAFDPEIVNGSDGEPEDRDSGDERQAYRSIHGKAKEEDDVPRHMELVKEKDVHEDNYSTERQARQAELSRALKDSPADVSMWLRLIDHQDILILAPDEDLRPLTYNEQQSVADVKLALYEKAIKQCAASLHKDRLLLGRLQEGARLWDTSKLLAQWNKTLQENSQSISLWVSYLNFRQTDFQNFDFEQLMATFSECLELNASNSSTTAKHQVQCYLFLRMTLFIREAGYLELAVGLWQAVLEFTCFKPRMNLETADETDSLVSFRGYWEDELPRVGEKGSLTWRGSFEDPFNKVHTYAHREYKHSIERLSLMDSWKRAEIERTLSSRMPSRTLDQWNVSQGAKENQQYVDDPYSVVLFSDFDHILKLFHDLDPSNELLDGFLYFCHLPHLTRPHNTKTTRLWSGDNFLRNESIDLTDPDLSSWVANQSESEASFSPLRFPIPNFLHTTSTFFSNPESWFDSFRSWRQNVNRPGPSVIDQEWVQMTLRALVERGRPRESFDEELAEYTLGLMFAWDPKKAKKYAKTLLKKWTSSLRVCNAMALMEWRNGSFDAAFQVWSSSVSWSQKLSDDSKIDCGLIWGSWAWELVQNSDYARASYVLHAIPMQAIDKDSYNNVQSDDMTSNPTSTLQAQSYLRECQARALGFKKLHSFVAYTDCLALLLFTEKYPIRTVLDVYSSAVTKANHLTMEDQELKPYLTELLHQSRARLLFFHCKTRGLQLTPVEIRGMLQESISLFPDNTIFLTLLMWNESRFNILDRVRNLHLLTKDPEARYTFDNGSTLSVTAVQGVPVTTHLLSIWSELCRPTWAGSTNHSTRAAFEKALAENTKSDKQRSGDQNTRNTFGTDSARTNVMTWKLYIVFEVFLAKDVAAAKAVFYRAIRACPWSKQLFMLAFQYLQDDRVRHIIPKKSKTTGLLLDDLSRLFYAMTEKQLRIHVNIEEDLRTVLSETQDNLREQHESQSDEDD